MCFARNQVAHFHFQGYCKGTLWPTFHNVLDVWSSGADAEIGEHAPDGNGRGLAEGPTDWLPTRSWSPRSQELCFPHHAASNGVFARVVAAAYNEGDVVWIHGYELLLLPSFLHPSSSLPDLFRLPTSASSSSPPLRANFAKSLRPASGASVRPGSGMWRRRCRAVKSDMCDMHMQAC